MQTGSYIRSIPLVLSGSIKVFREDDEGREVFLYYIRPGQSCAFTLASALRMEKSKVRASTHEAVRLLAIPADAIQSLGAKYPGWIHFLTATFSQRFDELLNALESVVFHSLDERLYQYLLDHANTQQHRTLAISHQQIADDLATSREVVSRLLKQMERKGWLKLGRGQIELAAK